MATSQQEMFTPLAPLIRGKLSSPRQGGLRGLLFMSWRKTKKFTETLHKQLFVLARFAFADVKLFAHAICGLVSRYSL